MNNQDIQSVAAQFGINEATVKTVIEIEASGAGFFTDWNADQRIKIQFEPHKFVEYAKKVGINITSTKVGGYYILFYKGVQLLKNKVEGQKEEWDAFNKAWKISEEAAMMATSWGLGQIMGFNHKAAGFSTVGAMVTAFKRSEYDQLVGMMSFIKNNNLLRHLQLRNWEAFAKGYNGSGYAVNQYDKKLAAAYARHSKK